jgi:DNA-binding transcriptional ArsR family regulator
MTKKTAKAGYRSNKAQLRALSSPVRIEIVGAFQSFGPMSIRELAERIARPADGLYHHMRQLQKVHILRVKLTRRVGKRDESVFELTAERFGHTATPRTPAMKKAIVQTAGAALRLAGREFNRAVLESEALEDEPSSTCPDDVARTRLSRQKSWLTQDDLVALQALLDKVERFLRVRMHRKQGLPFALTQVLVPLSKRKRV